MSVNLSESENVKVACVAAFFEGVLLQVTLIIAHSFVT